MAKDNDPRASVELWIERSAKGQPVDLVLQAFQRAFDALWYRAHLTLGDVTLMAIVDRVIYNAAERFPDFSVLTVEPDGLRTQALREQAAKLRADEVVEGVRFLLVEFLTVLSNLTADILTRALHAELAKVARGEGQ